MVGIIHLQQTTQDIGLAEETLEALLGHPAGEEGARGSGEGSASALHRRDVAVAAKQPEGAHARGVDPKHRGLGAQQFERGLKACVVGVAIRGDDEAGGLAQFGVGRRGWRQGLITRRAPTRGLGVDDRPGTHDHSLPLFLVATV